MPRAPSRRRLRRSVWPLLVAALPLLGCSEPPPPPPENDVDDQAFLNDGIDLHLELSRPLPEEDPEAYTFQPESETVWAPDQQLVRQLGTPVTIDEYTIRPPHDFVEIEAPDGESFARIGVQVFQWIGPSEPGDPAPSLTVSIYPAVSTPRDYEENIRGYIDNMHQQWPSTQRTEIEHGYLGILPGVRTTYEIRPAEDLRILGRVYFVQDDLRGLMIDVKVVGEDAEADLVLLDAAAQTFRRNEAAGP